MNEEIELNIQPKAGILKVFSRLSYKQHYAIAEFVDNSTASFYSNEDRLNSFGIKSVRIEITYVNSSNTLTIKDNAYGMEIIDFKRAIILDSPPIEQGGRNEFGMGLKTAASWFGNIWKVESTQLDSDNMYSTTVDINEVSSLDKNTISITKSKVDKQIHGTTITITDVTKPIKTQLVKTKIIEYLEGIYRRDISEKNNNKVEIYFNGDKLKFEEYKPLYYHETIWRKDVDFSLTYEGVIFNINGYVGILDKGGYDKAGLALFRRNRVILPNYKPKSIYGQSQSFVSLRLYGEINLDDFPINQAKDGFVWDDGLEEEFVCELESRILDYIEIAKISNKERNREDEFSKIKSDTLQNEVQKKINNSISDIPFIEDDYRNENGEKQIVDNSKLFKHYQNNESFEEKVLENYIREYELPITTNRTDKVKVIWTIADDDYWFNYDTQESTVKININFSFFKPYSTQDDFKMIIEIFVLSFIMAGQKSLLAKVDGRISYDAFLENVNSALVCLTKESEIN